MHTYAQMSDRQAVSALLLAVHGGRGQKVATLLEAGSDVNLADADGITPLMAAAMNGSVAIARQLLEKGADPRVSNKWGMTAHAIAEWHGYSALAALVDVSLLGACDQRFCLKTGEEQRA